MFLQSFLPLHSQIVFCIFLKEKAVTALDMKDMEAACHFVTLMDHFLLLKSKIKSVLKTKLSNFLSKEHGTVLTMNLSFVSPWFKPRLATLASQSLLECDYGYFV